MHRILAHKADKTHKTHKSAFFQNGINPVPKCTIFLKIFLTAFQSLNKQITVLVGGVLSTETLLCHRNAFLSVPVSMSMSNTRLKCQCQCQFQLLNFNFRYQKGERPFQVVTGLLKHKNNCRLKRTRFRNFIQPPSNVEQTV